MKVFFLGLFLLFVISANASAATPGEVKVGASLREATLHGFDGRETKLSEYKGKPLIINVWASWCGPCRAEMGSLDRLARQYDGKEFNLIGISTDDSRSAAAGFIQQSGIEFNNYLDRNLLMEHMLGANTIPLTILIDANGRVVKKVRGAYEWDSPKAIDDIGKIFRIESMRNQEVMSQKNMAHKSMNQNAMDQSSVNKGSVDHDPMFGLHFLRQ